MSTIQILQLAGLNLTPQNWSLVLRRLQTTLASEKLLGRIYCIVVCGGLTVDESDSSYASAAEFLENLQTFLRDPQEKEWRRRLLVVPGRNTFASGFENFRAFYNSFFQRVANPFHEDQAMVRHLRDVTLVGVTYINGDSDDIAHAHFGKLQHQLRGRLDEWHGLDYIKQGPIIVAAAESPLFNSHLRQKRWQPEVGRSFHMADLYLFGSGQASFLPSEPFAFAPASLGLGPEKTNPAASLPMNHIEFRRPAVPRGNPEQPSHLRFDIKLTSYSIDPAGPARWTIDYLGIRPAIASHPDERFLHNRFIEQLSKHLQRNFFVTVLGYGDVWRDIVARGLRSRTDLAGAIAEIKVISPLQSYPPGRPETWRGSKFSIAGELEQFKRHPGHHTDGVAVVNKIAVIVDEAFSSCDHNRRETYEAVRRELAKLCNKNFRIVYLVNAWEVPSGPTQPPQTSTLRLEPLDRESFETLMELFSLYVPLDRELITRLSGGYVSFITLLFAAVKEHFQGWDIEREPTRDACLSLVEHALEVSDKLRSETQRFFEFMKQQPEGIKIVNFLFSRFKPDGNLREWTAQPVTFSRDDLLKANIVPADVSALEETGIIRDAGGRFELLERMPFLVRLARPAETPKVFISYAQPDLENARELDIALRRVGLQPWDYTRASKMTRRLHQEIMDKLKESSAVVVVWTSEAVKSAYVLREAREAAKPKRPKLINWFVNITPPSIRDQDIGGNGERTPNQHVLAEFKDFLGKENLEEIVRLLVDELAPFQIGSRRLIGSEKRE